MRKLVLQMQMSVDGFVGAGGDHDWQVWGWGDDNRWDEVLKRDFNAHFQSIDTILLSRKMAEEGYLSHWGDAAKRYPQDPFYAFAQRIIDVQKVVPSDRLEETRWERTVVRSGDLSREVGALKAEEGGNIAVFGGAGFASALIAAGLVDEFQFYINPAALGGGRHIFDQADFGNFRLLGSKAYACGIVVNRYEPLA
ncbi:dihydrofolate reductase family protein [Qingshengfaniella alkalisoli]|uniref:Deaminase n=1 Tax=Qingshengfaniella alkalisoli TaxID=2599296 RepID=A0A5B8J2K3_9RHOB|nr:dihydrofolate reductase family protein [Qingshengfaniella alkalisoli]QDY71371.1 deaminase [Qingshengfaniella alkalisoli]